VASLLDREAAGEYMVKPTRAYALLRLRQAVAELQDFVDEFFKDNMVNRKQHEDMAWTSHQFILSINTMLFSVVCMSSALVQLGHKVRDLVELEQL
jgi:hypothetical protein